MNIYFIIIIHLAPFREFRQWDVYFTQCEFLETEI